MARPGRRCGGGWRSRRGGAATVVAATLAALAVVVACLAAATRGTPALAPVDGGDREGASAPLVAFPRGRSLLPTLESLASRASEFGSGPCSSSACIGRWKGGFIAALFVEGLIGAAAPQALNVLRPSLRARSLRVANAFGGGVLFATGMLHILPEAVAHLAGEGHGSGHGEEDGHDEEHEGEEHEEGEEHHDEEDGEHGESSHGFPTGYALAVAGFYAILFLEYLVLGKFTHSHGTAAVAARDQAAAKGQRSPQPLASAVQPGGDAAATTTDELVPGVKASDADYTTMVEDGEGAAEAGGVLQRNQSTASARSVGSASTDQSGESSSLGAMLDAENVGFFSPNFGRALLAAASVAIHAVIESLSLGLASSWPAVLNTFLAIATHKWATAASLGVKFEKERLRRLQSAALIIAWSAVTPASAGIGAAIDGGFSDQVTGVLLALSAGTLLYIGVFEVTAEEFVVDTRDRWPKAAAMVLGAGVIMAVTAILSSTGVH